jgi:hypothetical protein
MIHRATKDELLALAVATGRDRAGAAKAAGVSEPTVTRRMRDPDFRARVAELRAAMVDRAVGLLSAAAAAAVAKLATLLKSENERVSLRTAVAILENVVRLKTAAELEERLARVEAALAERHELDQSA